MRRNEIIRRRKPYVDPLSAQGGNGGRQAMRDNYKAFLAKKKIHPKNSFVLG